MFSDAGWRSYSGVSTIYPGFIHRSHTSKIHIATIIIQRMGKDRYHPSDRSGRLEGKEATQNGERQFEASGRLDSR